MSKFGDLPDGGSYEKRESRPSGKPGGVQNTHYLGKELAPLGKRYAAALIDYGILILIFVFPRYAPIGLTFALFLIWLNSAVMQGLTGRSIGKLCTGIMLAQAVADRNGDQWAVYPGVGLCTKRLFWHVKDLFTLGLEPTRSVDRQTRADQDASTLAFVADDTLKRRPRYYTMLAPR